MGTALRRHGRQRKSAYLYVYHTFILSYIPCICKKEAAALAGIFDYLTWRGDLTFAAAPFNEVDNMIFSMLAYIDLTDVVPAPGDLRSVPLHKAAREYFEKNRERGQLLGLLVPDRVPDMLCAMSGCARYRDVLLSEFVKHVDLDKEEQFSAVVVDLGNGTRYISFCGTDDTIVGWKENFNMSFSDAVPSQVEAERYLTSVASSRTGAIRLGGHSKGGNLAVYASMHCPDDVRGRIIEIYNNDGPGFRSSIIDTSEYREIRGRVWTLLPQSSVIGMLMEHEEDYEVVKSTGVGVLQHDGFTWEVLGPDFVHADSLSDHSKYLDKTLKLWLEGIDMEQRKAFIDAVFAIMESSGSTTLSGLNADKRKTAASMFETLMGFDKETRSMIFRTIGALFRAGVRVPELPSLPNIALPRFPWLPAPDVKSCGSAELPPDSPRRRRRPE